MRKKYLSTQKEFKIFNIPALFLIGLFVIIISGLISSCSDSSKEKSRFMKAYKEILIARESTQDTAKANKEVQKDI
jgi:hypothetical protein